MLGEIGTEEVQGLAFLNGILGDQERHAYLGAKHLEADVNPMPSAFELINSPSHGLLVDSWMVFRDKIGWTTPAAKQLARILIDVQEGGRSLDLVAHSGGGAMFSEAIRVAYNATHEQFSNIHADFHGGANNIGVTNNIMRRAGVTHFGGIDGSGYRNNPFDAVPQVIGMNGLFHPTHFVGSLVISPRLFQDENRSPHTLPYMPPDQHP